MLPLHIHAHTDLSTGKDHGNLTVRTQVTKRITHHDSYSVLILRRKHDLC